MTIIPNRAAPTSAILKRTFLKTLSNSIKSFIFYLPLGYTKILDYFLNNQRTTPRDINPTSPALPRDFTSAIMFPTTSPRKAMLAGPTRSVAIIASASSAIPSSVIDLIEFLATSNILVFSTIRFVNSRSVTLKSQICNHILCR
jgi:hypothetical protein